MCILAETGLHRHLRSWDPSGGQCRHDGVGDLCSHDVVLHFYIGTLYLPPSETWYEALSTCSSHITVVVLFFVPILFIYIRPATMFPEDKMFSSTPSLFPCSTLWFTLRNTEMKNALRKMWCQKPFLIARQIIWKSLCLLITHPIQLIFAYF